MADTYTIQFRRGMYADFDTSKIRPGEPVAILGNDPSVPSGKALYIAFAANDVRRLCSIEDISEMANAGEFVGPQGPQIEQNKKDINLLKEDLDTLNQGGLNLKEDFIGTQVNEWLNEHPEATTTVQDGSLTELKMHPDFLPYIKNNYVTPEMFGAKGDGVTDDTRAIKDAIASVTLGDVIFFSKKYFVTDTIKVDKRIKLCGNYAYGNNETADGYDASGSVIEWGGEANKDIIVLNKEASMSDIVIDGNSTTTSNTPSVMGENSDSNPSIFEVLKEGINGLVLNGANHYINNVVVKHCSNIGVKVGRYNRLMSVNALACGKGYELYIDSQLTSCRSANCDIALYYSKNTSTNIIVNFRSDGNVSHVVYFSGASVNEIIEGLCADQCGKSAINAKQGSIIIGASISGTLHRIAQVCRNRILSDFTDETISDATAVFIDGYCLGMQLDLIINFTDGGSSYGDGSAKLLFPKVKIAIGNNGNIQGCKFNFIGRILKDNNGTSVVSLGDLTSDVIKNIVYFSSTSWIEKMLLNINSENIVFTKTKNIYDACINGVMHYGKKITENMLYLRPSYTGCFAIYNNALYIAKSENIGDWELIKEWATN